MELAIHLIADLIQHLKEENQKKETRCFYCAGLHKTVDCCSQKRDEFVQKLIEIQSISERSRKNFFLDETTLSSIESLYTLEN